MSAGSTATPMDVGQFTCSECGIAFTKEEDADRHAFAEERDTFGFTSSAEDRDVLCDDCYRDFMGWWRSLDQRARDELLRPAKRGALS